MFPNPGIGIVGTDPARIGPGVDRQEIVGGSGGDMHRAAIDADDEVRFANQMTELEQCRLVR